VYIPWLRVEKSSRWISASSALTKRPTLYPAHDLWGWWLLPAEKLHCQPCNRTILRQRLLPAG
jgi:hypothetical protein